MEGEKLRQAMQATFGEHGGEHTPHIVPTKVFVTVWVVLVTLTSILVALSQGGEMLAVGGMLLVTPLKAGLVVFFFMHLRYERPLYKTMLFVCLGTFMIFIGVLFADIAYR
jgi:cytochrome c oxidase subunit IV